MANNNKKKRTNYFQQNIDRAGPNFMEGYPLDRMRMDAVKVFRELARGNIDIDIYGKYFYNDNFIEACITTAEIKYNFHLVSAMGVERLIRDNVQGKNIFDVYEFHNNACNAYYIIMSSFVEFKRTRDINVINTLVLNLTKYRYNI